jgi:hypothetical protein
MIKIELIVKKQGIATRAPSKSGQYTKIKHSKVNFERFF